MEALIEDLKYCGNYDEYRSYTADDICDSISNVITAAYGSEEYDFDWCK